jgi:hypothetical protein
MPFGLTQVRATTLSNILFGKAWKSVVAENLESGALKKKFLSAFTRSGYIKAIYDTKRKDEHFNINIEDYWDRALHPEKFLQEGSIGFPIIFTTYALVFSEKVNVLSGFNEIEYLVSTGANPRRATIGGFILPWNALMAEVNPIPLLNDIIKSEGGSEAADWSSFAFGEAEYFLDSPPPDPAPLVKLYEEKLRVYKSIKEGKSLFIYGPAGLMIKGQIIGLNLNITAEMSSVMQFTMEILVTKVITRDTPVTYLSNVGGGIKV